jgi:hypothetical protein
MYPHISYYPRAWKLEGSNDEASWNTVDTRSAESWPYWGWKTYTVNSPGEYRYYRFTFTSSSGDNWLIIYEIEMFDKTGLMEPEASDTYPSNSPSSAFDGSTGSYWENMNFQSSWLEKDLGTKKTIREYELYPHISYYPRSWTLQGSNDGTTYSVLDTRASQSWPYWGWKSYIVAHPSAYRFYRWVFTGSSGDNWYIIYEIATNDYSSATNPIASDTYPSNSPSSAFDGDIGTYWENTNQPSPWLQKDFGSAKTLTSYDIYPHISYYPTAWTVQGSTDGTAWTNIDSRASQSWAAWGWKSYTVTSPGSYRFYRWMLTSSSGDNWYIIYEIKPTTS